VRHAVLALVGDLKSNNDDDPSPEEVARVTLLRVLGLQAAVHRARLLRQREAAALLARTAIEACLIGLYFHWVPEAGSVFEGDTRRSLKGILGHLTDYFDVNAVIDSALDANATQPIPVLRKVVESTVSAGGPPAATNLYERLYVPLSSLYSHTSAASLARHSGGRKHGVHYRPRRAWSLSSSADAVDACVGILAASIADAGTQEQAAFVGYAERHLGRVMAPALVLAAGQFVRSVRPARIPLAINACLKTRRYLRSDEARSDTAEVREERMRAWFKAISGAISLPCPPELESQLVSFLLNDFG
jgi:hypothetical protein